MAYIYNKSEPVQDDGVIQLTPKQKQRLDELFERSRNYGLMAIKTGINIYVIYEYAKRKGIR